MKVIYLGISGVLHPSWSFLPHMARNPGDEACYRTSGRTAASALTTLGSVVSARTMIAPVRCRSTVTTSLRSSMRILGVIGNLVDTPRFPASMIGRARCFAIPTKRG